MNIAIKSKVLYDEDYDLQNHTVYETSNLDIYNPITNSWYHTNVNIRSNTTLSISHHIPPATTYHSSTISYLVDLICYLKLINQVL